MRQAALALLLPLALTGCASTMSGLDGETKFACKAPEGVSCASLSGVYANAVANNLPALQVKKGNGGESADEAPAAKPRAEIVGKAPSSGDPIRTPPKVLRVWIAPWEDAEGDLHDQAYIYMVADYGRWVIEHTQRKIIDRYRPTFIKQSEAKPQNPAPSRQTGGTGVVLPGQQYVPPANNE
ncbi:hypothetical protein Hthe01_18880 [Hydrogenophilus thermoluteolus]|nr:hypothetical protein Hthe01_18880 [Hydrogenophilus thermoluteolus]